MVEDHRGVHDTAFQFPGAAMVVAVPEPAALRIIEDTRRRLQDIGDIRLDPLPGRPAVGGGDS